MNKLFYLIIGLFILNSCSKKIINHNQYNLPTSDLEIIDQAYSNNPNYKHLNLKGIASIIIDDVETKFNINLKMIKDSVMWLSVRERVIGIELLRAKLTPDSLYLLNRLEKSFFIKVDGIKYQMNTKDKYDELLQSLGMDTMASKKVADLKAPMPGLVLDISVEVGQEVFVGDTLLILEAMKMENVIKSPTDGVIKSISVNKTETVEKNQLILNFE